VITHDDDWRDVFREVCCIRLLFLLKKNSNKDGLRMTGRTSSELQQAIFDCFEIVEEDGESSITLIPYASDSLFLGGIFLRAKSEPTPLENEANSYSPEIDLRDKPSSTHEDIHSDQHLLLHLRGDNQAAFQPPAYSTRGLEDGRDGPRPHPGSPFGRSRDQDICYKVCLSTALICNVTQSPYSAVYLATGL
jgi:hypothetical protein